MRGRGRRIPAQAVRWALSFPQSCPEDEIMSTTPKTKAASIGADAIESIARAGVERALAARGTVTELSSEQVDAVSGGAALSLVLKGPIIYGGPWLPRMPVDIGLPVGF
jgi:hypothetical protein